MPKLKAQSNTKTANEPKYSRHWSWDPDYLGNKYKAIYFGPKLDWMHLSK